MLHAFPATYEYIEYQTGRYMQVLISNFLLSMRPPVFITITMQFVCVDFMSLPKQDNDKSGNTN